MKEISIEISSADASIGKNNFYFMVLDSTQQQFKLFKE
jgi:hypothetical protein